MNTLGRNSWLLKEHKKATQAVGALVRALESIGELERCRDYLDSIQDRINAAAAQKLSDEST